MNQLLVATLKLNKTMKQREVFGKNLCSFLKMTPSALSQAAEVKVGKVSAEEAAFIEQSVKDLREGRCVDTPVTLT